MNTLRVYMVIFLLFLFSVSGSTQELPQPVLKVTGEVIKTLSLQREDLQKLKLITATLKGKNGEVHKYGGVAVQDILEMAGVTMGKDLRGENLAKYLLAKCADGYKVVFTLAELDSSFTDRVVMLAYESSGKPLPTGIGPFRIVVPGEKKPARSSFQVTELVIRFAKE